ncbi:hypothetical protein GGS23DRAFT_332509 [Durotheca rogersii]|uniref:uncharacterized protein n=1 Tax=Durotheca rogersii TaxID=419775 RepID=UPI002220B81C|nr:uncharacterized protein GGS23DRAFT_332509 [Durotheca rogersii]KAI5858270.1 hypothetical protein GGS23DRAFT_332509 [Durotheca rogersii]
MCVTPRLSVYAHIEYVSTYRIYVCASRIRTHARIYRHTPATSKPNVDSWLGITVSRYERTQNSYLPTFTAPHCLPHLTSRRLDSNTAQLRQRERVVTASRRRPARDATLFPHTPGALPAPASSRALFGFCLSFSSLFSLFRFFLANPLSSVVYVYTYIYAGPCHPGPPFPAPNSAHVYYVTDKSIDAGYYICIHIHLFMSVSVPVPVHYRDPRPSHCRHRCYPNIPSVVRVRSPPCPSPCTKSLVSLPTMNPASDNLRVPTRPVTRPQDQYELAVFRLYGTLTASSNTHGELILRDTPNDKRVFTKIRGRDEGCLGGRGKRNVMY